jgi:hypothetical protein
MTIATIRYLLYVGLLEKKYDKMQNSKRYIPHTIISIVFSLPYKKATKLDTVLQKYYVY